MDRKIIYIDIDETLNELIEVLMKLYGEKYNDPRRKKDIEKYYFLDTLKPECKNFFKEFCTEEVLETLEMVPHAKEVVEELIDNHDVFFLTAAHPNTLRIRDKWLKKHIDNYSSSQFIRCNNKTLLKGHLLIDDCIYNHYGSIENSILVNQPWNEDVTLKDNMVKLNDWYEIEEYLVKEGYLKKRRVT